MADPNVTLKPLSDFLAELAGECRRHDRDLANLASLISALGDQSIEQGGTISDLQDQVSNLADITAGLGRLIGQQDETEVGVDLATAPAPATAPPAAPPRPPRKAPAASPAPSGRSCWLGGIMHWPPDTDELKAERERLALEGGIQAPRRRWVEGWWRHHRNSFGEACDGGIRSCLLYDRLERRSHLNRDQLRNVVKLLRRMGVLVRAVKGRVGACRYTIVVAPAYRAEISR